MTYYMYVMKMLLALLGRVTRLVAMALVTAFAYQMYLLRKYEKLIEKSGFKRVPILDYAWWKIPFGNFFWDIKNFSCIYDAKVELMKSLGMPLTVIATPPFWC